MTSMNGDTMTTAALIDALEEIHGPEVWAFRAALAAAADIFDDEERHDLMDDLAKAISHRGPAVEFLAYRVRDMEGAAYYPTRTVYDPYAETIRPDVIAAPTPVDDETLREWVEESLGMAQAAMRAGEAAARRAGVTA